MEVYSRNRCLWLQVLTPKLGRMRDTARGDKYTWRTWAAKSSPLGEFIPASKLKRLVQLALFTTLARDICAFSSRQSWRAHPWLERWR